MFVHVALLSVSLELQVPSTGDVFIFCIYTEPRTRVLLENNYNLVT